MDPRKDSQSSSERSPWSSRDSSMERARGRPRALLRLQGGLAVLPGQAAVARQQAAPLLGAQAHLGPVALEAGRRRAPAPGVAGVAAVTEDPGPRDDEPASLFLEIAQYQEHVGGPERGALSPPRRKPRTPLSPPGRPAPIDGAPARSSDLDGPFPRPEALHQARGPAGQ